jgi:hypothetical protein
MAEPVRLEKELSEHEQKQEWWWVAEKKRSKRLDYLRKAVWKKGALGGNYSPGIKLDLEMPTLFTNMWRFWKYDSVMLRRAKAFAHVLDNISIFITDQAQIVGYMGSLPHTIAWRVDGASMVNEEAYNEPGIHTEPEEESLKKVADLNEYWAGQTAVDKVARLLDPEDVVKFMSGAIGWGVPTSAYGYSNKNYEYFMTGKRAFEDIIQEIDRAIEKAEDKTIGIPGPDILSLYDRIQNWEAMKIVLEAGIRYAKRYARLARIIAENFESDPKRKEELLRVAETCERVPAKPPRTLQESLQYDFFVQILSRLEAHEGAWPSRPDYYHGPYYDRDVNIEKNITREEAQDLVGEFMIRTYEVGGFGPRWAREGLQGITGTWVWTIGGVKPEVAPQGQGRGDAGMLRVHSSGAGLSEHPARSHHGGQRHALARPPDRGGQALGEPGLHVALSAHQARAAAHADGSGNSQLRQDYRIRPVQRIRSSGQHADGAQDRRCPHLHRFRAALPGMGQADGMALQHPGPDGQPRPVQGSGVLRQALPVRHLGAVGGIGPGHLQPGRGARELLDHGLHVGGER